MTTYLLLAMVLNGIIFFPPSELIYLLAFQALPIHTKWAFLFLAIANTLGHIILFYLAKSLQERKVFEAVITSILARSWLIRGAIHGPLTSEASAFFGRFVPVVKTGISITLAGTKISWAKYVFLTLSGNVGFAFSWYWYFVALSSWLDRKSFVLIVIVTIIALYLFHSAVVSRHNKN